MPGMELTNHTFIGIAEHLDLTQRLALQTALGSNRTGLIPNAPWALKALFTNDQLEIDGLQCMALLPSGRIVNAEENVQIAIPMLFGNKYYLTIGFDNGLTEYEREGVPMVRPKYKYEFCTKEEVETRDVFPLMRFHVENGVFSINQDYIPPCLLLSTDKRIKEYIDLLIEHLRTITEHQNLAEGEGKRSLTHYLFRLKTLNMGCTMNDFILLTHEIAHAVDYYIMMPNQEQTIEVPIPSIIDIQEWTQWLSDYLKGAAQVLESVVLEDNTIDYEALLAQAKKELYEQLNPELTAKILETLRLEIRVEIEKMRNDLDYYLNEELRPEILKELTTNINEQEARLKENMDKKFEDLNEELKKTLFEKLYLELFENLFNALYVPEPEDRNSMPMI